MHVRRVLALTHTVKTTTTSAASLIHRSQNHQIHTPNNSTAV